MFSGEGTRFGMSWVDLIVGNVWVHVRTNPGSAGVSASSLLWVCQGVEAV